MDLYEHEEKTLYTEDTFVILNKLISDLNTDTF